MEFLNKVELQGVVGMKRITPVGESNAVNFSLVTNYAYRDKDGMSVIDTTWFNVVAWEGKSISKEAVEAIEKGSWVKVTGRIRVQVYDTPEGEGRQAFQVVANKVEILNKE